MKANLLELGIEQATVFNNDSNSAVGSVPANTIEVTVGEISPTITNEMIAQVILSTNSMGCPTYGTTAVVLTDTQGVEHTVSFTKAVQFDVEIDLNVTFLSTEFAGAEEGIKASLVAYINGLASGEDIIWSRLFAYITPYGEAQINSLDIGEQSGTLASSNIVIADDKYSNLADTDITITVV
jgi:uncharacterized phage protein gp47/JayE